MEILKHEPEKNIVAKDISEHKIQVWSTDGMWLDIMTVKCLDETYNIIRLGESQGTIEENLTVDELVDHLNIRGFVEKKATLTIEE